MFHIMNRPRSKSKQQARHTFRVIRGAITLWLVGVSIGHFHAAVSVALQAQLEADARGAILQLSADMQHAQNIWDVIATSWASIGIATDAFFAYYATHPSAVVFGVTALYEIGRHTHHAIRRFKRWRRLA